jgi:hypothetical protein
MNKINILLKWSLNRITVPSWSPLLIHSWRRRRRVGQGGVVEFRKKGTGKKIQGKPQMSWERMEETSRG